MHEMPVTQSILDICLKHAKTNNVKRIYTINLVIGEMSDLEDEWIQRYFDYLSKDTIARGARLKIRRTPVVLQCRSCSHRFEIDIKKIKDISSCPECEGEDLCLISGKEYYIKDMEAE